MSFVDAILIYAAVSILTTVILASIVDALDRLDPTDED